MMDPYDSAPERTPDPESSALRNRASGSKIVRSPNKVKIKAKKKKNGSAESETRASVSSLWSDDEDTPIVGNQVTPGLQGRSIFAEDDDIFMQEFHQPRAQPSPNRLRPEGPPPVRTSPLPSPRQLLQRPQGPASNLPLPSGGMFGGMSSLMKGLVNEAHKQGLTRSTRPSELGKLVTDLRSTATSFEDWRQMRDGYLYFEEPEIEKPKEEKRKSRLSIPTDKLIVDDLENMPPPPPQWAVQLRDLLEEPSSSTAAIVVNVVITIAILLSFVGLLTKPIICEAGSAGRECREHPNFFYPDVALSIIFTLEYFSRLIAACGIGGSEVKKFLKDYSNAFDILAVMPTWLNVIWGNASGAFLSILRICRFLKLARIIRMMRLTESHGVQRFASKRAQNVIEPSAVVMLVVWAIFMKETLSEN